MRKQNYLIPRFSGGKRDHKKYRIWDGARYDAVIEPFAGGSAFSQQMILRGCKNIFLGECDRLLLSIYQCWLNPESHQAVYDAIADWQKRFHAATYSPAKFDLVWDCLKQRLDKSPMARYEDYPIAERAAASLVLRKLTFGGVVRLNTQGMLNVKWVNDTIPGFLRWSYRFPFVPEDCNITIVNSWQKCVSRFHDWAEANPEGRAIALVDTPYFANLPSQEAMDKRKQQNGITPAYPGHEPHSLKTLNLSIAPVRILRDFGQVKRIVVTNYYSDQLDQALRGMDAGLVMRSVGKLDGLNQTRSSGTEYEECVWELGEAYATQTSLLELEPCLV